MGCQQLQSVQVDVSSSCQGCRHQLDSIVWQHCIYDNTSIWTVSSLNSMWLQRDILMWLTYLLSVGTGYLLLLVLTFSHKWPSFWLFFLLQHQKHNIRLHLIHKSTKANMVNVAVTASNIIQNMLTIITCTNISTGEMSTISTMHQHHHYWNSFHAIISVNITTKNKTMTISGRAGVNYFRQPAKVSFFSYI